MNSGAGGGVAVARADAPAVLAPPAAVVRAAAQAHVRGAAREGSDTNSMNRGAGGGTVGGRADAPPVLAPPATLIRAAAQFHERAAACEGSDTNAMMSLPPGTCPGGGAGGGTAGVRAEARNLATVVRSGAVGAQDWPGALPARCAGARGTVAETRTRPPCNVATVVRSGVVGAGEGRLARRTSALSPAIDLLTCQIAAGIIRVF